ncbi:MAG: heat shock protein HtpX [Candidatus Bathyarchaeota archaeon BA1]|nr:MAG: heat shock protein HtpX [Candidatus Bathyarchaeota archaeon BA1]
MSEAISFLIDTEVTSAYLDELLKFIRQHYILALREHFTNIKLAVIDHDFVLAFTALGPEEKWHIDVEVRAEKPIRVRMVPGDRTVPQAALDRLKEDLIIGVQLFEERVRRTTLYFAWVEGEKVIPEKTPLRRRKLLERILLQNMLLLFIIFIAISIFVFMILGPYAPMVLIAFQLVLVLVSDKIIAGMGDWSITEENPSVHLLQYHLPAEEYVEFRKKYSRDLLIKIKGEIYQKTLAIGKAVDCETAEEVLSKYGSKCLPENMSTKTVNVHQIVKKAAGKFNTPTPKIAISNTILPNAAASGPSPKHGIVLITTGLLVQLEDDEILSVVGHEFSHLKGRDPLILFTLTASEYLLRVYVFLPLVMVLGYLYLLLALTVVYFIAKFFEAKADLESAIKIGSPHVLAQALRKIGFRKLQFERIPAYRFQEWIRWDPHPPIYFRVSRLEKLKTPETVKHPLIQSIKDNIRGFLAVLTRSRHT